MADDRPSVVLRLVRSIERLPKFTLRTIIVASALLYLNNKGYLDYSKQLILENIGKYIAKSQIKSEAKVIINEVTATPSSQVQQTQSTAITETPTETQQTVIISQEKEDSILPATTVQTIQAQEITESIAAVAPPSVEETQVVIQAQEKAEVEQTTSRPSDFLRNLLWENGQVGRLKRRPMTL